MCTHAQRERESRISGYGTEEKFLEKRRVFKEDFDRTDRDRTTDRNRELVPDNWNLVRERALPPLDLVHREGWCSEHSGVSEAFGDSH